MKCRIITFVLFILFVCPVILTAQDKPVCAHEKGKCCEATSFENCPAQGCGGDPELNKKKNTLKIPTSQEIQDWKISNILGMTFPALWKSGTKRTKLEEWGEGTAVRIKAFLIHAKNYASGMESCNCNLRFDQNNDYHLVLVEKKTFEEANSVTAEISPRIREDGWTIAEFKKLAKAKTYVRVTGWMMLDTQHIKRPLKRLSNWEIHPVTKFEVCTSTVTACEKNQGWKDL